MKTSKKNHKDSPKSRRINTMTQTIKTVFVIGNTTYNESNGRYYKTENGKKTRIGKAAYDAAAAEWVEMVTDRAKQDVEQDEIDAITNEMTGKNEKSELPKGFKIESNWDGDTTTYFLYKDGKCLGAHWEYEDAVAAAVKAAKTAPTKKRRPKDIAHESKCGVTLTAKQVDFMKHLPDTCFWENGLDSEIWVDCLCDEIGGQFRNKPMTVGAMISTLCEKQLGERCRQRVNGRMTTSFKLTDLGKTVMSELGID